MLGKKIIRWYSQAKRDLPWRRTGDPYLIWLSEVILQQTRVSQGLPYYERFVSEFPTVTDLAAAEEVRVLRLWQGLGYYSRARNMHAAAGMVMREFGGAFPRTYRDLIGLKGVGPYTAAAIASISSGERVPVVDGNVYRVLSRMFEIDLPINASGAYTRFSEVAAELMGELSPGEFNQAMMELGATVCHPKNPDCGHCPVAEECGAFKNKSQAKYPVKDKKVKTRERFIHYLVFRAGNKLWVRQRGVQDIWAGLYDFYPVEKENAEFLVDDEIENLFSEKLPKIVAIRESREFLHVLSHQRIRARFWEIELEKPVFITNEGDFMEVAGLDKLPKPKLVVNYLSAYFPDE